MQTIRVKITVPYKNNDADEPMTEAEEKEIANRVKDAVELKLGYSVNEFEFEDVGTQPGNDGWEMDFDVRIPGPENAQQEGQA